ncbi:MAG: hypothetical protein ACYC1Q_05855 [Bacteroidia bacterium]
MNTPSPRNNLNWFQRLSQLPDRFQISFSQMLKNASSISRVITGFSLLYALGLLYILLVDITERNTFFLSISGIDIMPLYSTAQFIFYALAGIEFVYALIIVTAFWSLDKFIKSIDPKKPFANQKSKNHISRVAWMSQGFFIANLLFRIIKSQAPSEFWLLSIRDQSTFAIFQNTNFLFPFNYLILAFFVSIFARIFKQGISINSELEQVI